VAQQWRNSGATNRGIGRNFGEFFLFSFFFFLSFLELQTECATGAPLMEVSGCATGLRHLVRRYAGFCREIC